MKKPIPAILVGLFAIMIWGRAATAGETYPYWPAVVKLTGTLIFERRFGPPGYGNTPDKDEKLEAPFLFLDAPITVVAAQNDPNEYETETDVTQVQISMPAEDLKKYLYQSVTVEGRLSERRWSHDFASVFIDVENLSKITEVTPAAKSRCLEYEPKTVTLTGTITAHMNYGPPNYGEDPAHDMKEHYWRLDLDKPICVNGSGRDDPEMQGELGVKHLQIVYMNGYPTGGGWVGHRVSITGTLFHQISGHHHTRVLITADKTVKVR
jgi:hypothetical protein